METLKRWAKLAYHETLDLLTGWATRNPRRAARVLLVCGVIFALLVLAFVVMGGAAADRGHLEHWQRGDTVTTVLESRI